MRSNKILITSIIIFSFFYVNNVNAVFVDLYPEWRPNEANLGPTLNQWVEEDVLNRDSLFRINLYLDIEYGENYSKYFNELNFTIEPTEFSSTYNITKISVMGCEGEGSSGFGKGVIDFSCKEKIYPDVNLIDSNYARNSFLVSTKINKSNQYQRKSFLITYTIPNFPIDRGDDTYVISSSSMLFPQKENLWTYREIMLNSTDFILENVPLGLRINSYVSPDNRLLWSISTEKLDFTQFTFSKASEKTFGIPFWWALFGAIIGGIISFVISFFIPYNVRDLKSFFKLKKKTQ